MMLARWPAPPLHATPSAFVAPPGAPWPLPDVLWLAGRVRGGRQQRGQSCQCKRRSPAPRPSLPRSPPSLKHAALAPRVTALQPAQGVQRHVHSTHTAAAPKPSQHVQQVENRGQLFQVSTGTRGSHWSCHKFLPPLPPPLSGQPACASPEVAVAQRREVHVFDAAHVLNRHQPRRRLHPPVPGETMRAQDKRRRLLVLLPKASRRHARRRRAQAGRQAGRQQSAGHAGSRALALAHPLLPPAHTPSSQSLRL